MSGIILDLRTCLGRMQRFYKYFQTCLFFFAVAMNGVQIVAGSVGHASNLGHP